MTSNPYADDASAAAIPGVPHRWNALTIALTAIGFIVFWPLGLAMVVYVIWGEKIAAFARGPKNPFRSNNGFSGANDTFSRAAEDFTRNMRSEFGFGRKSRETGNAAFDAWRAAELKRIEDERRKLDETTAAFEAHLRAERGGVDDVRQREEFDRFMRGRGAGF
ncbi:DUF2852 domain-containing protein [Methylopila sp. Yamaguchi]|uniref:DUF2852 domain-containing protein n=1 Tax=Methylopila sp. Yamaguchi TaxID=1437817 RepID=UPI000CAB659C|nr:DUF2852 domain-containing protein [Methylopila sp. Yamaguchi]GBD48920.1 putative transmembrane protein [Methylopila sp. Yamaguchi]